MSNEKTIMQVMVELEKLLDGLPSLRSKRRLLEFVRDYFNEKGDSIEIEYKALNDSISILLDFLEHHNSKTDEVGK